jgi:hypothetical protein
VFLSVINSVFNTLFLSGFFYRISVMVDRY